MEIYDLIIIGSGPAGLTAAIYATRAELKTLVLEKAPMSGGQILNTYEVDNYPGLPGINGFDMGMKFREHAEALGASFSEKEVLRIEDNGQTKKVFTNDGEYLAKTLILATGAKYSLLNIPGEIEFSGMGVSYCATCDGAFFRNKTTVVVGGGDVAIEDAIFLSRICTKVYLVHRRNELRGAKSLQKKLFSTPNIEVVWDTVATEIKGSDKVESVTLKNVKTQELTSIDIDGIFIAVGIIPNTDTFKDIIKTNESGYILADESCETNIKGIFAAGDLRTKALRQIITAAGDGANAVTSVESYLNTL